MRPAKNTSPSSPKPVRHRRPGVTVLIAFLAAWLLVSQGIAGAQDPTETDESTTTTTVDEATTTTAVDDESTSTTEVPETTTTTGPPAPADTEDDDGPIVAAVVPTPGVNQSLITVKVGGDRSGVSGVLPKQGVTLQLFDNSTTQTPTTFVTPNTCVSDVDGDCNWLVQGTGLLAPNNGNFDRRFYVRQIDPPAPNSFSNPSLNVGAPNSWPATTYQFQTCPQLRSTVICSSQATGNNGFMVSTGAGVTGSGGIWQTSRANPGLTAQCGLRVALILDLSNSVGAQIGALHTAATTFVNSLVGTPSSIGLFTFASNGPANTTNNQNRPLTSVSTTTGAGVVNAWINGTTVQPINNNPYTNWDRALNQVTESTQAYDIALVVTDGSPTAYGPPPATVQSADGGTTRFREVENGIFSANGLKAEGTRVVAFGVGAGVNQSAQNLQSISGPTPGSDYFQTTNYPEAAGVLRQLALAGCIGTVSVIKEVIPPGGTIDDAAPAPDWTFGATTTTSGVTIDPTSAVTDATGGVSFDITYPGAVETAEITVTETQQAGHTLVQQGGFNAACRNIDTGAAIEVANVGDDAFQIASLRTAPISCTVYNQAPTPAATIQVDKQWIVNGTTYPNGTQPPGLSAEATIDGTPVGFGSVVPGFFQGDLVSIGETPPTLLPLCTLDSSTMTLANGAPPVPNTLPHAATLQAGANTYQITNVVTCTSSLELAKEVVGGTAEADEWTLTAVAPGGALPGPSGATGVTANVTPGVVYPLAESGGNPNYLQQVATGAVLIPGSTGSWTCVEVDAGGNPIPGFSDGLNGGVTVPLGQRVRCTATNLTSQLTLVKTVSNTWGGTLLNTEWDLTATPTGTPPEGVVAQTVSGQSGSLNVLPGWEYALSESVIPGYSLESLTCFKGGEEFPNATAITLEPGQAGLCLFTNADEPALLTLSKVVDPGVGDATDVPEDWTLEAVPVDISGQGTVSGNGDPTTAGGVNQRKIFAGTYTLGESGPDGYSASDWTCTGGVLVDDQITVTNGEAVECEITNTALGSITINKTAVGGDGIFEITETEAGLVSQEIPTLGGSGSTVFTDLEPGDYDFDEIVPDGWVASDFDGDCDADGTITLEQGEHATCTITNTALGSITINKLSVGGDGVFEFTEETLGALEIATSGASGLIPGTGSDAFTDVPPGIYDIDETAQDGWISGFAGGCDADGIVTLVAGQHTICTVLNVALGSVTIEKTAVGGDGIFEITETEEGLESQSITTAGGSGSTVFVDLVPGTFDFEEVVPDGWVASDFGDDCSAAGTITVNPGEHLTCSITNTALGSITINKTAVGGDGTFEITETVLDSQSITTSGGSGNTAFEDLLPGDFDFDETAQDGWVAGDFGGDCAAGGTVTLAAGEHLVCTITNTALGSITINKTAVGGDGTFEITETVLGSQDITTTGGAGSAVFEDLEPGDFDFDETPLDGWSAGDFGGDCAADGTITLQAGEDATCTITNTAIAPTLTLVKEVDNGTDFGDAVATDWTLSATDGTTTISGLTGDASITAAELPVGSYTLAEEGGPDGYLASDWVCEGATGSDTSSVELALGDEATCTITNTAIPPTLTLVKEVDNGRGGTAVATDWTLSATDGTTTISGLTGDASITSAQLPVGSYTLSESDGPDGYLPSGWSCVGGTDTTDESVDLQAGDSAVCTIVNTDQPALLTLTKVVDNGDGIGSAAPEDWVLTAAGPALVTGTSGSELVTTALVPAGTYELSELGPEGYEAGSWQCTNATVEGNKVTIRFFVNVECTITNTAIPATLTLVKEVNNDLGGVAEPLDWVLTATGPSTIIGRSGESSVTQVPVAPGEYFLEEANGPSGYTASDWDCPEAVSSTADSVVLAAGSNITCTIINTAQPVVWAMSKTSSPPSGSVVAIGSTITYTITARIVSGPAATNVVISDDLSGVVNQASVVPASIDASVGTTSLSGSTLTWNLGTLTGEQTLSYQVVLERDLGVPLRNAITGSADTPPEECVEDEPSGNTCSTENPTPNTPTGPTTTTTTSVPPGTPATAPPGTPPGSPTGTPTGTPPTELSHTGANNMPMLLLGLGLVTAGFVLILSRRRIRFWSR